MCQAAGYEHRGIPLRIQPSRPNVARVNYGPTVAMAEALTQDWVAKVLSVNLASGRRPLRVPRVCMAFSGDNPDLPHRVCCIVMEHIDTPDCDEEDDQLVAQVPYRRLSASQVQSVKVALYFAGWTSAITYDTVE